MQILRAAIALCSGGLTILSFSAPTLTRVTSLRGDTGHVQGIELDDSRVWVSSVDKAARKGFLQEFRRSDGEHVRTVEVTHGEHGEQFHPGGICADGESLWLPVAEYRPASNSVVQKRNMRTLGVEYEFAVSDHIGCIAAAPDVLIGANWDGRELYIWDKAGRLIRKLPNPGSNAYQDMKFANGIVIASGLLANRGSAIDWLEYPSLRLIRRLPLGRTDRGIPYASEGMAHRGDRLFLLPEDSPSRLFEFRIQ